jgi:lactobin A/cerein 7B family class IIb bacteriocin
MKTFENIENLNAYGVVAMNETDLQNVEGGIIPLIIGGLFLFDVCLWGYILS